MTYLRNTWYVAATSEEVSDKIFARTFMGEGVVLYRTQEGEIVATQQHCPHRYAPLDQGKLVGNEIQCPYHGLRFAPDGTCTQQEGRIAPANTRLKIYPTIERHKLIWIWMGEASLADPAVLPDYSVLEEEGFGWFVGYLHVEGSYQLMVDNLLDLSHTEFLHPLLASEGWSARNSATIEQGTNWVTVDNVLENDNILPIMAQMRPDMEPVGNSIWHVRWNSPSSILLRIQYVAAQEKIVIPSGHFLTPETEDTTHYFVRGGHDVRPTDPEFTALMRDGVLHVFDTEDVPMIEAQQKFLGKADLMDKRPAILKADAAAVRARRLLTKLIRDEQNPKVEQMVDA